jgi:GGDEF domain-containing protein
MRRVRYHLTSLGPLAARVLGLAWLGLCLVWPVQAHPRPPSMQAQSLEVMPLAPTGLPQHTAAEQDAVAAQLLERFPAGAAQRIDTVARRAVQVHLQGADQVTWVALRRPQGLGANAYLELPFALLDQATLYWRDAQGHLQMRRSGDRVAVDDWPVVGRYPTFDLGAVYPPDGRWVLALRHHAATGVPLRLTDTEQLSAQRQSQGLLLGAGAGVILLVILLCGVQFATTRDAAYGWYAAHASAMFLLQFSQMGLMGQYVLCNSPWLNDRMAAVLAGLVLTTLSLFLLEVVRGVNTVHGGRWIAPVFWGVAATGMALAVLQLVAETGRVKVWISVLAPICFALMVAVLAWAAIGGNRVIRWVLWGYTPLLVGVSFPLLANAGLMDVNFLSLYGVQLAALVEIPVVYFALTWRHRERHEKAVREQALSRSDPTTGLLIRRLFAERAAACAARARRLGHSAWLVGVEIANLKRIEEVFDPLVANKALVVGAGVLVKMAREVDEAGRLTHHMLGLLVEGPMSAETVQAQAVEMVAAGLRPSEALPPGVRLQLRVTAVPLGMGEPTTGEHLVEALLQAAAVNRGKRAVRVLATLPLPWPASEGEAADSETSSGLDDKTAAPA